MGFKISNSSLWDFNPCHHWSEWATRIKTHENANGQPCLGKVDEAYFRAIASLTHNTHYDKQNACLVDAEQEWGGISQRDSYLKLVIGNGACLVIEHTVHTHIHRQGYAQANIDCKRKEIKCAAIGNFVRRDWDSGEKLPSEKGGGIVQTEESSSDRSERRAKFSLQ